MRSDLAARIVRITFDDGAKSVGYEADITSGQRIFDARQISQVHEVFHLATENEQVTGPIRPRDGPQPVK